MGRWLALGLLLLSVRRALSQEAIDQTRMCGSYRVHVYLKEPAPEDNGLGEITIRDKRNSVVHHSTPPGRPEFIACGKDLLGLHRPMALVRSWTGGMHCCYQLDLFELGTEFRWLMSYDMVDEHGYEFRDLDRDGVKEFITIDDTFAYHDTCYTCSGFPIRVYGLVAGSFRDRTTDFPAEIRRDRDEVAASYAREAKDAPEWPEGMVSIGMATHLFIDAVELGREAEFWSWAETHLSRYDRAYVRDNRNPLLEKWRKRRTMLLLPAEAVPPTYLQFGAITIRPGEGMDTLIVVVELIAPLGLSTQGRTLTLSTKWADDRSPMTLLADATRPVGLLGPDGKARLEFSLPIRRQCGHVWINAQLNGGPEHAEATDRLILDCR